MPAFPPPSRYWHRAAGPGIRTHLFNRWFDPATMAPCGPASTETTGDVVTTSTASTPRRARYCGAYVARIVDGQLLPVLTHGVDVPGAVAAAGPVPAVGGQAETLSGENNASMSVNERQSNFVSLWDSTGGRWLANLTLPEKGIRIGGVLFSDDGSHLYAIASYPRSAVYV